MVPLPALPPPARRYLNYEEVADQLAPYAAELGYTHIELLPIAEHPFDGSWGYQATGYYAPTSRYGTPEQFMYFVDKCHEYGLGVILDWVPGHFCKDDHGMRLFDGTPQYEPADPRLAEKTLWGTLSFDFGKPEVRSFLVSNAMFWFDMYHIDGLRVDAVASMLDRNFDKPRESWTLNAEGGGDYLEAADFLRQLNATVSREEPHALMIAEDSSDRPGVTRPAGEGGYGFHYKWNMGWMNDILRYMKEHPADRRHHHSLLTFSLMYAYSERFILPFSHDEVVHGKHAMLDKMPGDYWQKFANLRLLYGYMAAHPGGKLLFMGGEYGQFIEWKDSEQLDWHLLGYDKHRQLHDCVRDLNALYADERALWEADGEPRGFQWVDVDNAKQSVLSFVRYGAESGAATAHLVVVCNFTDRVHHGYRVGVPSAATYTERFNTDWERYGGSNQHNPHPLAAEPLPWHGQPNSIAMTVPPLAAVIMKPAATTS